MDSLFQALAISADGAFVIDEDQRIVYWNKAAQEILGYSSEEVLGRSCYEILGGREDSGQMICRHSCFVTTAVDAGSPVTNYDTCAHARSGETRWISVSILVFPAPDDDSSLIVHLFRDASQKKQNEQFAHQVLDAVQGLRETSFPQATLPASPISPAENLTDREREVLSLLAQGLSTRNIADALSISPSTARNHIQNILHKLHVHSRLEAVAYAFEHGLV